MQKVAASRGAPIRAIATSALREAKNGPRIVARMRKELGLEVEVISGPEEARLIYSGVLQVSPSILYPHKTLNPTFIPSFI
jgi:exopolyphosphatase/guanosine-5'-triphosphate,3'-diphosphate pyrophosphatase